MSERNLTLVVFTLNEIEGLKAVGPRVKRVLTVNTHLAVWLRVLNKKVCEISGDEPARIRRETKQNYWYNGAYESYTIISLFLIRIFNKNYFLNT